jgi:glycerate kinase
MAEEALEHADLVVKGEGEKDQVEQSIKFPSGSWRIRVLSIESESVIPP